MKQPLPIKIYDSFQQELVPFEPLNPPEVKMYVCGPTVYDELHVGNFRSTLFYHFVREFLTWAGYKVRWVYNFTDVDDKIIQRAQQEGISWQEVSEKYIAAFWRDFQRLGLKTAEVHPRVTEHIEDIQKLIQKLVDQGYAYVTGQGDVYYRVHRFETYGALSHRKIEQLRKGVRKDPFDDKEDPLDFALWKASQPPDPSWPSPWGWGRPGWHIECSALIARYLGYPIDIHGGGMDLIFPHHENERAQSEACCQVRPFVKYWIHNNMVQVQGTKMSKSLGNVILAREFMDEYHPETFKFLVHKTHYRSVLDLNETLILQAMYDLSRLYQARQRSREILAPNELEQTPQLELFRSFWDRIVEAATTDFNSALVVNILLELWGQWQKYVPLWKPIGHPQAKQAAQEWLYVTRVVGQWLSLFQVPEAEYLSFVESFFLKRRNIDVAIVEQLVQQRTQARQAKNFELADKIRHQLGQMGILVHDLSLQKSVWEVNKNPTEGSWLKRF